VTRGPGKATRPASFREFAMFVWMLFLIDAAVTAFAVTHTDDGH
jgi:hypothetical protein